MIRDGEVLHHFTTREEFREWLHANSTTANCCWILLSKSPRDGVILYLDAVEEALCYGWIDGVLKKYSDTQLVQRFSPRRKNGNWTELNKERVRRLERMNLMTEHGRNVLPNMSGFEIHPEISQAIKSDPEVYENFQKFPELYRRIRIDTIQSELKMNNIESFKKRLEKFIQNTRENKIFGEWNDGGRLLEHCEVI